MVKTSMNKYTLLLYRGSNRTRVILQKDLKKELKKNIDILCALTPVYAKSIEEAEVILNKDLKRIMGK
jgi:hypothetical protein